MGTDTSPPLFSTDSLSCAAALLASGLELSHMERVSAAHCHFGFNDPRAREAAASYVRGELQVSALDFVASMNRLRVLVKQGRGGGR